METTERLTILLGPCGYSSVQAGRETLAEYGKHGKNLQARGLDIGTIVKLVEYGSSRAVWESCRR